MRGDQRPVSRRPETPRTILSTVLGWPDPIPNRGLDPRQERASGGRIQVICVLYNGRLVRCDKSTGYHFLHLLLPGRHQLYDAPSLAPL
jgi:hypothetical protein